MRRIRIGTRGSRLALWQATWVARALAAVPLAPEVEVVILRTRGDEITDRPLSEVGGTGLFVKEIERALLEGRIDLGVHSLKDLETRMPPTLVLAAVPARGPAEDVLVAAGPATVDLLPRGARVATGSPRRRALLLARRPDLEVVPSRGNVPTRVERVLAGEVHATVLARAGLERLEMGDAVREVLDPVAFPPAPGQGALALQARAGDDATRGLAAILDHGPTRAATDGERAFLRALGSGCTLAAGAWGRTTAAGGLLLDGFLADGDGRELHRGTVEGGPADGAALGESLGRELLARASAALREAVARDGAATGSPS